MAKKKIKDLTLKECLQICKKNSCSNCPLKAKKKYKNDCFYAKTKYKLDIPLNHYWENKEVEVDDK